MTDLYTQEDAAQAPPGHMPLPGTDLELVFSRMGTAAVVHVNKAGVMICRVKLDDALCPLSGDALTQFSNFAPDFVFKVGDTREGIERLKRVFGFSSA